MNSFLPSLYSYLQHRMKKMCDGLSKILIRNPNK